jgi:hypothetical protein
MVENIDTVPLFISDHRSTIKEKIVELIEKFKRF